MKRKLPIMMVAFLVAVLTIGICGIKSIPLITSANANEQNTIIIDAGQPTVHFNVLRERGIDSRRVIIDEASPIYHICADKKYPPMLVIVSDDDIENRYEQTILLRSTLKHFGYSGDSIKLKIGTGGHCYKLCHYDENGNNLLGLDVIEFISNV